MGWHLVRESCKVHGALIRNGLWLLVMVCPAAWQVLALDPSVALDRLIYKRWTIRDGMPSNSVSQVIQTPEGFVWIATQEGLVRFDGSRFKLFDPANTPLLGIGDVRSLAVDEAGVLWVGTHADGLLRYGPEGFSRATAPSGTWSENRAHVPILALLATQSGLWVGTGGLGLIQRRDGQWLRHLDRLPAEKIVDMAPDGKGGVWLATDGQGLWRYRDERFEPVGSETDELGDVLYSLELDERGRLWIGTAGRGLFRWTPASEGAGSGRLDRVFLHDGKPEFNHIYDLLLDRDGVLWFASGAGIGRLHGETLTLSETIEARPISLLNDLFEDRSGNLWIGGAGSGVHRLSQGPFQSVTALDGLNDDMVWCLAMRGDDVWIQTDAPGFDIWDGRAERLLPGPDALRRTIFPGVAFDSHGNPWFASVNGLFRLVDDTLVKVTRMALEDTGEAVSVNVDGLFFPVFVDSRDRVWFGMEEGIGRLQEGRLKVYWEADLASVTVQAFAEDNRGQIWVGTDAGLFRIADERIDRWPSLESGLPAEDILAVYADERGCIWLGTGNSGLMCFSDNRFHTFSMADGLFDDAIFSVLEDDYENLWLSSNLGVCMLARSHLEDLLAGRETRVRGRVFGYADGMKSPECNSGGYPVGTRSRDGVMYFPTTQGVTFIDTAAYHRNPPEPEPPRVFLEQMVIDGRVVNLASDGQDLPALADDFHDLQIHFSALDFFAPESLKLESRLTGYEVDWESHDDRRVAYYTGLPPGRYLFEVRATNRTGLTHRASQVFLVSPRLYQSSWFLWMSLLAFTGIAWLAHRGLMKPIERSMAAKAAEYERLREECHEVTHRLARARGQVEEVREEAEKSGVATLLLHNVGNVLNSVSVSAGIVEKMMRSTGVYQVLRRVADLVDGNRHDLVHFFGRDPQGRRVARALHEMGDLIDEGNESLVHELANLNVQAGHLNEIVKSMREIQKGRPDRFDINILIEDAVKMQSHALRKHSIEVEQNLEPLPPVRGRKSQILQILVNLIKNAYEAIVEEAEQSPLPTERMIAIYTHQDGDQVIVEVCDSGPGIEPDHLDQVFSHGFTTKPRGHGFGLHYCRKVMREMEGDLTVRLDGPLRGATFVVRIPT